MFKIAIIGAGSITFTRTLVRDLLCVGEFQGIEIALMDIDRENLDLTARLCRRLVEAHRLPAKLSATTDLAEALAGAKYVVNSTRVGGLEAFALDVEIPLRYGVDQCVGDTLGPGGIMYGQRSIPVVLDFCRQIRAHARPGALLFNYGNPNAMLTWAANRDGGVPTVGLCHGVEGGHQQIAEALGLPKDEVHIVCAGINHQTWYIRVTHQGRDLTGKLLEAFERHPVFRRSEKVRIDMLRRFGYYSTESNGHLSEYLPWYRKRPRETRRWVDLGRWIDGETGGYLRLCRERTARFPQEVARLLAEPAPDLAPAHRSGEHLSWIIEGLETNRCYRGHFNVENRGCITNLPADAIVEVPGYADANGIAIPRVGDLPIGCAAVCTASVGVQRLAVEAAVTGNAQLLKQAMLLDPLTGAVCNPPEVWQMADEMLVAQARWLPQYRAEIARARRRRAGGGLIPPRKFAGGARRPASAPAPGQSTRTPSTAQRSRSAAR